MDASAAGGGSSRKEDLDVMLKKLGLCEEDLDDVVFEEESLRPVESTRCLAISGVHTNRDFNLFWFCMTMHSAWDLVRELKFSSSENNMYTMQFSCLSDWDKVKEGGPWTFSGQPILPALYDGFTKPSKISLNTLNIWILIHDLVMNKSL
jgi:hypothetical protein